VHPIYTFAPTLQAANYLAQFVDLLLTACSDICSVDLYQQPTNEEHTMTNKEYNAAVYAAALDGAYCIAATICAGAVAWAVAAAVLA
jgi:hypothetical protein